MNTAQATVFIVDDDASVRKALTRSFENEGFNVKAFASAQEFLDQAPSNGPGCLVLDVRLPDLNGLDLQAKLNARNITTPIVFITGHGDVPGSVKAMKAGAMDFLTKPFKFSTLLEVIQEAIKKDARLRASRQEKAELQSRLKSLTPREREVLGLIIKGRLNKQIADELGAAEKTIKIHRGRVMQKMNVKSVAELVHAVERLNSEGEQIQTL
jgi:FixJ family two-component response regulator